MDAGSGAAAGGGTGGLFGCGDSSGVLEKAERCR